MKAFLKGKRLFIVVQNVWVRTGVKCLPECWSQKRQTIKSTMPGYQLLNATLTNRKAELAEVLVRLKYENLPVTLSNIKKYYQVKSVPVSESTEVSALLLRYQSDNKTRLAHNYTRIFKQVADSLNEFCKGVRAEDFSLDMLNRYVTHLIEQGIQNNTISSRVSKIRTAMGAAAMRGVPVHQDWPKFSFKYVDPKPVWLTADELALLEKFIPLDYRQVFKDEFLFRCYTGLRFSDCQQLRPHHFIRRGADVYVDFSVVKTKLDQNIILSTKAAAIAKKWGYKVPKLYMQDCNQRIKEVCRGAKIKTKTEKVRYCGNERLVDVLEKWELVTTHVARRTFARMWLEKGGDVVKLMRYLGHSSTEQTLAYCGMETVEVNQEMKRLFG